MRVTSVKFVTSATQPADYPRAPLPEVAFAGRSNVGKSSLMNAILGRRGLVHTSKTPGRTQSINFFAVNERLHLVDLPGYGYAKVPKKVRATWGPMVERYFTSRVQLRGVVQLVDARHDPTALDRDLLEWLGELELPHLLVATKADKLSAGALAKQAKGIREALGLGVDELTLVSAKTGQGKREVWRGVDAMLGTAERSLG